MKFRFRILQNPRINLVMGWRFQTPLLAEFTISQDNPLQYIIDSNSEYSMVPRRHLDIMPGIEFQPVIASRVMSIMVSAGTNLLHRSYDSFGDHSFIQIGFGTVIGRKTGKGLG